MPVWRMPPPKSFRSHRAFLIKAVGPTSIDPIGAPRHQVDYYLDVFLGRNTTIPKPLLKHKLAESKGSHSSLMDMFVSAATCQILAPSRCILIPRERT